MADTFPGLTDGTYVFSETDNPNVFLFWREDKERLSHEEATRVFKEMFDYYLEDQLTSGKIEFKLLTVQLVFKISDDWKMAKLIVM